MNIRSSLNTFIALLLLSACTQVPTTITPPNPNMQPLGLIELQITGVGTKNLNASARSISSNPQARAISDIAAGIQILPYSKGSFEVGTRGVDGVRYLSATFKIRNAAYCTPLASCSGAAYASVRHNLSFIAVSAVAPNPVTQDQTAILGLRLFDGSPATTDIARTILPTHAMVLSGAPVVLGGSEDFQAFQESDVTNLTSNLSGFGVTSVFPYGFVTRCVNHCTAGTRDLAANPAPGQFDGLVTFAMKMPLQATPTADPFSFSLLFEVVDDSTTRVTQSLEEQSTPSLVTTRATALTGAQVFRLPGGGSANTCALRTAGTASTPQTFLVNTMPALAGTPALVNKMFANANAEVTGTFGCPMNVGSSSAFTVNGSMTGRKAGTYAATGNNLSFSPTTPSRPGEEIEVSLTKGLSSLNGVLNNQSYTFRYRTAVTVSSPGTVAVTNDYIAGSFQPHSFTVADLNGDGRLDLITANATRGHAGVLIGNGDGTFQTAVTYFAGDNPLSITTADLNRDGKLDLITANRGSNSDSVLIGNGDGTFQTPVFYTVGTSPSSVTVGDLNGDGKLDLSTANSGSNNASVLIGNGDGTFQTAVNYGVGTSPFSVTAGDLNADGKLDLITANSASNNASVLIGNGDGTFQTAVNYGVGTTPNSVTAGDLNGDGKLDLMIANSGSNSASVLIGNGDGTFQTAVNYTVGISPSWVTVADLNGDGKLDLITANINLANPISSDISVLIGNGDGTFQIRVNYNVGHNPQSVAAADLNGDGKLDLITANPLSSSVTVLLQP